MKKRKTLTVREQAKLADQYFSEHFQPESEQVFFDLDSTVGIPDWGEIGFDCYLKHLRALCGKFKLDVSNEADESKLEYVSARRLANYLDATSDIFKRSAQYASPKDVETEFKGVEEKIKEWKEDHKRRFVPRHFKKILRYFKKTLSKVSKNHEYVERWGTRNPMKIQDPATNLVVDIRGHGKYVLQAKNKAALSPSSLDKNKMTLKDRALSLTLNVMEKAIGEFVKKRSISCLDLEGRRKEIGDYVEDSLCEMFNEDFGLHLKTFTIEYLSLDEIDRQRIEDALEKKPR